MAYRIETAFHHLYEQLAALQRKALSLCDLDLQLVVLQAWGVPMSPGTMIFCREYRYFLFCGEP